MVYLFFTGGSGNRGCEAIVRGTCEILKGIKPKVFTAAPEEEKASGLSELIECFPLTIYRNNIIDRIKHLICGISYHFGNGKLQTKIIYSNFLDIIKSEDTYFVIGGDVYCYGKPYIYYRVNEILKKNKKILWGCSIEPNNIDDEMIKDLLQYNYIYARESITYNTLKDNGIKNVSLFPDPAFAMQKKEMPLPQGFAVNNTIGINVSPLIENLESEKRITMENYQCLIQYIIEHTDCQIALIPHVIWENSDDRKSLSVLYNLFVSTGRVIMLNSDSAEIIKGYISRCRFMIAARTHASIAAYSTCVPTLVVGYSVKAKGIAKDIFGEYDHFTIPVQMLKEKDDLLKTFLWLWKREDMIREHLLEIMPGYMERLKDLSVSVKKIITGEKAE